MDPISVITLGHKANVPLIGPSSELVDGLEPHGIFHHGPRGRRRSQLGDMGGRGVPGAAVSWVPGGVLYRVLPSRQELRLI